MITMLVGFLLSPFVVHRLGNTGYGIWTLILSLTGYFGMLDLGIRSSVGRFVARYLALNDDENVNRTVNTALALLGSGGVLAVLATAIIALNFATFRIDRQFEMTARTALLIAGLNIGLALPMGVFGAVLVSLERFDAIITVTAIGTLTRASLVVLFLKLGYGLTALAAITLLVGAAEYAVTALWVRALYPRLRFRWRFIDIESCKELFGVRNLSIYLDYRQPADFLYGFARHRDFPERCGYYLLCDRWLIDQLWAYRSVFGD